MKAQLRTLLPVLGGRSGSAFLQGWAQLVPPGAGGSGSLSLQRKEKYRNKCTGLGNFGPTANPNSERSSTYTTPLQPMQPFHKARGLQF